MNILLIPVQSAILVGYIMHSLNLSGTIMIGTVVMIFRYQWELGAVFFELSMHYGEIVKMDTDVKSVQPIQADIEQLAHLPQGASTARHWHTLNIRELNFHHAQHDQTQRIFKQVGLTIQRGEKIALIGPSGGGKSTLLNLLCGLYTPDQVILTIDGMTFDSLEPLQAIATLTPQDPEIFENTIAFNITMDLPTPPEEIHAVIKLAGFSAKNRDVRPII